MKHKKILETEASTTNWFYKHTHSVLYKRKLKKNWGAPLVLGAESVKAEDTFAGGGWDRVIIQGL